MPQMSPLFWLMLVLVFVFFYFVLLSSLYFEVGPKLQLVLSLPNLNFIIRV